MKTEIFKSYLDFSARVDKSLNGVSEKFAKENPNYQEENNSNEGCWNCSGCSRCSRCSRCFDCSGIKRVEGTLVIPTVNNIHQKIYKAVNKPGALDMCYWHTCDTTHCRAGWSVHLAGEKGYALEKETSTEFAAMMIYKKSSDIKVSPASFYRDDAEAMEDIKRCAELESKEV